MPATLSAKLRRAMINHGVDLMGSGGMLSTAHSEADVDFGYPSTRSPPPSPSSPKGISAALLPGKQIYQGTQDRSLRLPVQLNLLADHDLTEPGW